MSRIKGFMSKVREESMLTYVPSHSKSKSIIDISSTELRDRTWKRKPGRHLTQTLHHSEDGNTSEGVAKQDRQRAGTSECATNTEEETCTNGTTKCDELDVSRLEAVKDRCVSLKDGE